MKDNYFKYIDYYGNYSLNQIKINEIDYLIFATLSYLPYVDIKDGMSLKTLGDKIFSLDKSKFLGTMTPKAIDLLESVYNKKRYRNIRVYKIYKENTSSIQFGVISFRYKNNLIVSFEGTNNAMSGWIENFKLVSTFPTITHEKGLDYLNKVVRPTDKNIYLTGHSKGGNTAMVCAYLVKSSIFNRIKKIYNFDGPGFRKEEFNTPRFKEVNMKTINYLPDGSLVGILLFNRKYNYLSSDGIAFQKHYPYNWKMYGGFFEKAELEKSSANFKAKLDNALMTLDYKEYNMCVKQLDKFFRDNKIINTYDFKNIKFDEFVKVFNDIKGLDKNTKEIFISLIKSVFFNKINKSTNN